MLEQGAVYVLVNSSYPGLNKVGCTTRLCAERVAELSAATGVPTPFVLAYEQQFADCGRAEREIHAELDRRGWRIKPNREFFRGSPGDIIRVIQAFGAAETLPHTEGLQTGAAGQAGATAVAGSLLAEADRHLHGTGPTLQDAAEAARLYRAAALAGSLVALERLAILYVSPAAGGHQAATNAGRRRAMRLLKQGAFAGNYYCLAAMGSLFASDRHLANFTKVWDQFFIRRDAARCAEAEAEPARFAHACRAYITACLDLGLAPQHLPAMADEAETIMMSLLQSIDQATSADTSYALARVLRWTYQTLLPLTEARHGHGAAQAAGPTPRPAGWLPQPAFRDRLAASARLQEALPAA